VKRGDRVAALGTRKVCEGKGEIMLSTRKIQGSQGSHGGRPGLCLLPLNRRRGTRVGNPREEARKTNLTQRSSEEESQETWRISLHAIRRGQRYGKKRKGPKLGSAKGGKEGEDH